MLAKGGDTVIRKIVFSLICLLFSGMSVFATHIIMTDHALLTVLKSADLSAHSLLHYSLLHFGLTYWGHYIKKRCLRATALFDYECY